MKYNININQRALAGSGLNLKDGAILDYILFLCGSKSPKIEAERVAGATWVSYTALMKDMPLLEIKSRNSLTPRIKKIVEAGYITSKVKKVKGKSRLFVKLTDKVDSLFVENTNSVREKDFTVRETVPYNNTSNNNTKDNTIPKEKVSSYNESSNLPDNFGKTRTKRLINIYGILWKDTFGTDYKESSWARTTTILDKTLSDLTEMQISGLMIIHFMWRGTRNDNEQIFKGLQSNGFPIYWLPNGQNNYVAFLKNYLDVDFEDDHAIKKFVISKLQELK